jgi:Tol biopolymer transport system component
MPEEFAGRNRRGNCFTNIETEAMINKIFWKPWLLLGGVILSFYFVMGARVSPPTGPDIIFVRIPAEAKPSSVSINTQVPSDRYVDGCKIVRFSLSAPRGKVVHLTSEFLSACDPAVSFDGQKILFAGKQKKGEPWQIWQMDGSGKNKIQITHGNSDSVSPLYVGSLFHLDDKAPTRKIVYQGGNHLYTCDLDGKNPRRITYNLYPEFAPDVLPNGRIIFSSLKNNGLETGSGKTLDLLAVNIDGTDLMDYLTSQDVPGDKEMVRIARGGRVYFIQSDLSQWLGGGSLAFVSSRRPAHSYNLLTPNKNGFYHSPCPLPDGGLIVSYRSKQKGSLYGLKIISSRLPHPIHGRGVFQRSNIISNLTGSMRRMEASGGKYHCVDAQVLESHPVVKGRSSFVDHNRDTGIFYCISAYISDRPEVKQLAYGSIQRVRVLEGFFSKREAVVTHRILGTAPVEPDGSFHIRVPAKTPLAFQLLDKQEKVITSQHSWAWVMPRESRGCIGCHENRELAPPNQLPQAIIKPAVQLTRKSEQRQKKGNR